MPNSKNSRLKFNCYLLKSEIKDVEDALREKYRQNGSEALTKLLATSKAPQGALSFLGSSRPRAPKWAEAIEESFEGAIRVTNISHRLIIFLPIEQRWFAVCFGYGSSALDWDAVDTNFGLQVASRMLQTDQITELRSRRVDISGRTQEISMVSGGTIDALGVDIEGEYVRKLIGKQDPKRGDELKGAIIAGDSIAFQARTDLSEVERILKKMLSMVKDEDPAEEFAFIDAMEPLRSSQKIVSSLKDQLTHSLFDDPEYETEFMTYFLEVALPDDVKFEEVEEIKIIRGSKSAVMTEPSKEELRRVLTELKIDRKTDYLKNIKLLAMKADGSPASNARSLSEWLIFEAGKTTVRYILTLGKWFRFKEDFTQKLDADLANIPDATSSLGLPDWPTGVYEADYCKSAQKSSPNFMLFDRVYIKNSDKSMVEVCDLFHSGGQLIHIKKDSGAPSLSHLFAQGSVSAGLLISDQLFKDNFVEKTKSSGVSFQTAAKMAPIEVVYAIAHSNPARAPLNLPTFSKINLRNHITGLRRMKVNSSIARIKIV